MRRLASMGGEGGGPAQGSSDFTHPPSRYLNKHGRKSLLQAVFIESE